MCGSGPFRPLFMRYARSALISPIFDLNPLERARTELKLAPGFLVRSAPKRLTGNELSDFS